MTTRDERHERADEIRREQLERRRQMDRRRERHLRAEEIRADRGLPAAEWRQLEIKADAVALARELLRPGPGSVEEKQSLRREYELRSAAVELMAGGTVTIHTGSEVRAGQGGLAEVVNLRPGAGDGRTIVAYGTRWNTPARIASLYEGVFIERLLPGSWTKSLAAQQGRIKALYNHGRDPQIGMKPLGWATVTEDERGAHYELPVIDTGYARDVLVAAREGLLGSSFAFSAVREVWRPRPKVATRSNPERLPERDLIEVDVKELGPVTYAAYSGTTTAVRTAGAPRRQTSTRDERLRRQRQIRHERRNY